MYEDINNPALLALMGAAAIVAYIFLSTGLKALAGRTNHFDIITPALNSCFDCMDAHVLAPEEQPLGVALKELEKTTIACRSQLRDLGRLPDKEYMDKWNFVYEEAPNDYTATATKCPDYTPFVPKLVNKDGSIT